MPAPFELLSRASHWLGRHLCPRACVVCLGQAEDASGLCAPCALRLPWLGTACTRCAIPLPPGDPGQSCGACLRRPPPLEHAQASFRYGFPLDRLLPRFKFHGSLACGRLLSEWMLPACAQAPRPQALVPVPLHHGRLRERGYDQALELARPLARMLDLPLRDDLLVRRRATAAQSTIDAAARRRNLRDAFALASAQPLPAHLALVDDVMTTGATLHAAARALRRAGVARVDAWICARVP